MIFQKVKRFVWSLLRAANHDFCPSINRLVYWIKEPIGWVVTAILFSLLVGLKIGPQGYILAAGFTAFLVFGLVWPWLSLRGIRCSLVLPQGRVIEGDDVNVVFRVKNYWPLPVFGMMVKGDFLQQLAPGAEPIAFSLQHVRAWSETEFTIKVTPRRRGRLPSDDVVVSNGFPFGLVDISQPVTRAESTLVWPASQTLLGFPQACTNGFSLRGALVDRSGNDGDTIGVRCYQDGDRLRNIHWAQSARNQRLMVREKQKIVASCASIVIDLTPDHHVGVSSRSSYECAIRIAATLCKHLHESGSSVRLVCVGLSSLSSLVVDNSRGISTVFDFLAELPTLELARARMLSESNGAVDQNETFANRWASLGTRKFLIATDRTDSFGISNRAAFQSITIQLKEFASDLENYEEVRMSAETLPDVPWGNESGLGSNIAIVDPELAASQFVSGWKENYGHVA